MSGAKLPYRTYTHLHSNFHAMVFANLSTHEKDAFFSLLDEYVISVVDLDAFECMDYN